MTVYKFDNNDIKVQCDFCTSSQEFPGWPEAEVMQNLAEQGWTREGLLDVCPSCSARNHKG